MNNIKNYICDDPRCYKMRVGKRRKIRDFICYIFLIFPIFFIDYISSFSEYLIIGCVYMMFSLTLQKKHKVLMSMPNFIFGIITIWVVLTSLIHNNVNSESAIYLLFFLEWVLLSMYEKNNYIMVNVIEGLGCFHMCLTILIGVLPVEMVNMLLKVLLGSKYSINYNWRVGQGYNCGITLQPGENALYILLFFAVVFCKRVVTGGKKYLVYMFMAYIALMETGKRSPILISILVVLLMLLNLRTIKLKRRSIYYMIAGIGIFMAGLYYIVKCTNVLNALYAKMLVANNMGDISGGRFKIWDNAVNRFLQHPIIGCGIKSIYTEIGLDVHNNYLQFLAELGIVGLLLLLLMIICIIRRIIQQMKTLKADIHITQEEKIVKLFCSFMLIYIFIYAFVGNPFIDYVPLQIFILVAEPCIDR